jgi:ubiquinone/menaquinone biosynthesis C-methylase UbiE
MPIDFHSEANRTTYAQRDAGEEWARAIRSVAPPEGRRVADVGCGGGVYSTAWLDLGATRVTGVDFSAAMLSAARERCGEREGLAFVQGEADATGLDDASVDIVFERALVHHVPDMRACFAEARRIVSPSGTLVVQDRTIEDVARPGTPSHLRGYFFEKFPHLMEFERARRPTTAAVDAAMRAAGFANLRTVELVEVRRTYANVDEVRADLMARTGRSILHELDDTRLAELADHIASRIDGATGIRETDHWTIWTASR